MVKNKVIVNKLDKLERSLKKKLTNFYNQKIKGSPVPIDILKQQYNQQVKDIIRTTAQQSYLLGTDTVGTQVLSKDQDFQLFISATDLNNISQLSERLSNDFWNTAQRIQDREEAVTAEGKPKKSLDHIAALTAIAAGSVFSAFNTAVKSKSTQITTSVPVAGIFDPTIDQSLNLDIPIQFEVRPVPKVRFVTKHDSKVDPDICAPLDGTEWFVDDPSIVTPPDDTHRFCRCTLEPVID